MIEFWNNRSKDLTGLGEQLDRKEVQLIAETLKVADSSHFDQYSRLSELIKAGSEEAVDNFKYLSVFKETSTILSTSSLAKAPDCFMKLMVSVQFVKEKSKYYRSEDRIASLLRQLTHEIIRKCTEAIDLNNVFRGDTTASIEVLLDCIDLCASWKQYYSDCVAYITTVMGSKWYIEPSAIFTENEAFVQRCYDLIDVCEARQQFVHINTSFPGLKGPAITKGINCLMCKKTNHGLGLTDLAGKVQGIVETLSAHQDIALNYRALQWHDHISLFKKHVQDIESRFIGYLSLSVSEVRCLQDKVRICEMIDAVREKVVKYVESQIDEIYHMLDEQTASTKLEFDTKKHRPDLMRFHPDLSGSAWWSKGLLRSLQISFERVQSATFSGFRPLPPKIVENFEIVQTLLEDYATALYREWCNIVKAMAADSYKLGHPILTRKNNSSFMVTFDRNITRALAEAACWQKLKFELAPAIHEIQLKREELRLAQLGASTVSREYNELLNSLQLNEMQLFKDRIQAVDRKLALGETKVNWLSGKTAENFLRDSRVVISGAQFTVKTYATVCESVLSVCKRVSELMLTEIDIKKIYTLEEFETHQNEHRQLVKIQLQQTHAEIINELQSIWPQFSSDGADAHLGWTELVHRVDDLIVEALRISVKHSLQKLSKTFTSSHNSKNSVMEDAPVINVLIVLENQKVDFRPALSVLEERVTKMAREMIAVISVVPRIADVFNVSVVKEPSMHDVIIRENDVLKVFVSLQHVMGNNTIRCATLIKNWEYYKEIWEINKDAFMRRYAKLQPEVSTFDTDIQHYADVANSAAKQETFSIAKFMRLDCSPLKTDIASHCRLWQEKLTSLLNSNAATKLYEVAEKINSYEKNVSEVPHTLEDLSNLVDTVNRLRSELPAIHSQFGPLHDQYAVLEKHEVLVKDSEKETLRQLDSLLTRLKNALEATEKSMPEWKSKFRFELIAAVDQYAKSVIALCTEFQTRGPFDINTKSVEAINQTSTFKNNVGMLATRERDLRKGLSLFRIDQAPSRDLEQLARDLENINLLWLCIRDWDAYWTNTKSLPLVAVNCNDVKGELGRFVKRLSKLSDDVSKWAIYGHFNDKLSTVNKLVPVMTLLQSDVLRERHWLNMSQVVGSPIPAADVLTVSWIHELGFDRLHNQVVEIVKKASAEIFIEQSFQTIAAKWKDVTFKVSSKNQVGCIVNLATIRADIEDSQVSLSSIKSSVYAPPFAADIQVWETRLSHLFQQIESLATIQESMTYLATIFVSAEDIRRQLPRETSQFESANKNWSQILAYLEGTGGNQLATLHNWRDFIDDILVQLERIQKDLESFLETKRLAFPRFYCTHILPIVD